jgi:hypothetical protein
MLKEVKDEKVHSMETGTLLLVIVGVVLIGLLFDLLFTGGAMTGGMMGGMMMAASNPIGAAVLLIILGLFALFAYITWFA